MTFLICFLMTKGVRYRFNINKNYLLGAFLEKPLFPYAACGDLSGQIFEGLLTHFHLYLQNYFS